MATAIFYASSTGNTSNVAKMISDNLGGLDMFDLASDEVTKINEYDKVIIGASTWGEGELQDDWEEAWDEFADISFEGKTVALFGLGDQDGYPDEFLDAMGIIHDKIAETGGSFVGSWPVEGYEFDESKAVQNGEFVGLAIDEDNQDDLTEERVTQWCEQIKSAIV